MGGAYEQVMEVVAARWASADAIASVTILEGLGDDFTVGSIFHLGVIDERYLVEEIDLAADGQAVFDNIPQGEGDLLTIGYARSDRAGVEDEVLHSFNDDTVAVNYPAVSGEGRGAATAGAGVNQECAMVSGDNATALVFGALVALYSQYTKGSYPHFLTTSGYHESTGATGEIRTMSGGRLNIEPINKLVFEPNAGTDFKAGSLFSLYRIPKRIIERVKLTEQATDITFNNIPQNFEALILHVYARTDRVAADDNLEIWINGDAVLGHYDIQILYGTVAVVAAGRNTAYNQWISSVHGATAAAHLFGGGSIFFPHYNKTDREEHAIVFHGNVGIVWYTRSCRWEGTAAITQIQITPWVGPNFMPGSVFELEGILRKEGLPPSEGEQWGA